MDAATADQATVIATRFAIKKRPRPNWSLPAYSDAQPICGIGNRSSTHFCQIGSSRRAAAFALAP